MARHQKVRGKGKKDAEVERLRKRVSELEAERRETQPNAGAAKEASTSSDSMPKPKKRPRPYTSHDVRKLAYDYYEYMGGDVIDMQLHNARSKCRAFASQMRVAEGRDHFNQGAWGPNVTLYEERMAGALVSRLIKQKDELLEKYGKMMKESLDEQYEMAGEAPEGDPPTVDFTKVSERAGTAPGNQPAGAKIRLEFTEEEKQQYFGFIRGEVEPGETVAEIQIAIAECVHDPRLRTPGMDNLIRRASKVAQREVEAGNIPDPKLREQKPSQAGPTASEGATKAWADVIDSSQ